MEKQILTVVWYIIVCAALLVAQDKTRSTLVKGVLWIVMVVFIVDVAKYWENVLTINNKGLQIGAVMGVTILPVLILACVGWWREWYLQDKQDEWRFRRWQEEERAIANDPVTKQFEREFREILSQK